MDSDEARSWVESNFDPGSKSTRSYVKESNTQYYVTEENSSWYELFNNCTYLTKVIDGNISNVTNMSNMFWCCTNIETGMLAFYQEASSKSVAVASYDSCFVRCGTNTSQGKTDRSQIPTSWGGSKAA